MSAVAVSACGMPTGVAGLRWVFPQLDRSCRRGWAVTDGPLAEQSCSGEHFLPAVDPQRWGNVGKVSFVRLRDFTESWGPGGVVVKSGVWRVRGTRLGTYEVIKLEGFDDSFALSARYDAYPFEIDWGVGGEAFLDPSLPGTESHPSRHIADLEKMLAAIEARLPEQVVTMTS